MTVGLAPAIGAGKQHAQRADVDLRLVDAHFAAVELGVETRAPGELDVLERLIGDALALE